MSKYGYPGPAGLEYAGGPGANEQKRREQDLKQTVPHVTCESSSRYYAATPPQLNVNYISRVSIALKRPPIGKDVLQSQDWCQRSF